MALNPVEWALANPALVLTGVLLLVVVAWAYDAYREAQDGREALEGFAGRAKKGTGGFLNVILVVLVAAVGAAAQAAGAIGDLLGWIGTLIPQGPVVAAGAFSIGLGGLSLSSWLSLHPLQYVGIAGLVLVIAVAWRADL